MLARKLSGVPSPPPDNRVATNIPIMVRRSIMPMRGPMRGPMPGLKLLSGVRFGKRPVKFM